MTARAAFQTGRRRALMLALTMLLPPLTIGPAWADGEEIYTQYCALCHDKGLLNAPRFGQKKDWKKRLPNGDAALIASAVNGLNNMPPKGGYKRILSDDDVRAATLHLLQSVR